MDGDKRRQQRFKVTGPITVVTASGRHVEGQLVNVGLLGWRFSSPIQLLIGEQLSAVIRFPSGRGHQVEGTIKAVGDGPPYFYSVSFDPQTIERLIKNSSKSA